MQKQKFTYLNFSAISILQKESKKLAEFGQLMLYSFSKQFNSSENYSVIHMK